MDAVRSARARIQRILDAKRLTEQGVEPIIVTPERNTANHPFLEQADHARVWPFVKDLIQKSAVLHELVDLKARSPNLRFEDKVELFAFGILAKRLGWGARDLDFQTMCNKIFAQLELEPKLQPPRDDHLRYTKMKVELSTKTAEEVKAMFRKNKELNENPSPEHIEASRRFMTRLREGQTWANESDWKKSILEDYWKEQQIVEDAKVTRERLEKLEKQQK